jgi:hypothetical protein
MPLATFRCPVSGDQATVRLTLHVRAVGHADYVIPVPTCPNANCSRRGKPMTFMQAQYHDAGVAV